MIIDNVLLLVVVLAALEVFVFAALVGRGRATHGVPAPATTGPPAWERLNRIHQNSIEQLVVFVPLFLVFSLTVHKTWGAVLGVVFVAARVVYAVGYARAAEKRAAGAAMTSVVQILLGLGALVGLTYRFLR